LLSYFSPIPLTSITQHIVTKIVVENYFPFSLIFLIHPDPYDKVGSYEKSYSFSVHTMKPDCASLLQSNEYITMINSTEQVDVYLITERTQALKDQFFALFSHRESYFSDILDEKFRISLISRLYHHKKDNRVYIESFSVEGYSLMKLFLESFPEFAFSSPSRTPTLASTRYSNCNSIHIALFALMLDLFPKKNLPWTMFLDPFQKQHEQAYVEEDDEEDLDEDELEEEGFIEELDSFDDQMYEALLLFSDLLKRSRSRKKRKKKRINTSQLELFALNDKDSLFIHQFPLEKVGIIDPSLVERLALSFYEGEVIFCVTKDDDEFGLVAREALESLGNNDFKTRVEQTDFPEAIEDMISCFDDEVAYAILNTILYSLHYYYDEWVSAHALCVTVFRNYNELLMSRYDSREVVLSEISRFIYSQLCASGILQVNERVKRENRESGNYALKPTELFNALFLFNTNLRSR